MRALVLLLALSGCALHEQMIADRIAAQGPTCEKMGYTRDTDAFRNCQMQLYQSDQARAAAAMGFMQQSRPVTCRTVSGTTNCY